MLLISPKPRGACVGYTLMKGDHLPPVTFTVREASSLFVGEQAMETRAVPDGPAHFCRWCDVSFAELRLAPRA